MEFIPTVLLSMTPVLGWLQRLDLRLEGLATLELIRRRSPWRWIRSELGAAFVRYSRDFMVILGVSMLAAGVYRPTSWGAWPGMRSMPESLAWLVVMSLLTAWSWIAILLLVRMISRSIARRSRYSPEQSHSATSVGTRASHCFKHRWG
ncbi:MAG: hypothetical protein ACK5LN_10620 [Propioniciclava sp.]